jgi:NAD(P)-dependent dehydrogenase (short-subunit alcohol dehydrogenase family)
MAQFDGKTVIVTGSGSGIGRATAIMFAARGAHVVVSDIDEAKCQETMGMIEGSAEYKVCDVADAAQVEALVGFAQQQFGGLHAMVNNAGITGAQMTTVDLPVDEWNRVLATNLSGTFYGMKYAIPAILASGGGAIVNLSSILGQVGFGNLPAYVATKHGIIGVTRTAAIEYSGQGVRVNAVGPGFIETPFSQAAIEDPNLREILIGMHPIGRVGQPEEVAELITWLCSDAASFCTGGYYPVDGGYLDN